MSVLQVHVEMEERAPTMLGATSVLANLDGKESIVIKVNQ